MFQLFDTAQMVFVSYKPRWFQLRLVSRNNCSYCNREQSRVCLGEHMPRKLLMCSSVLSALVAKEGLFSWSGCPAIACDFHTELNAVLWDLSFSPWCTNRNLSWGSEEKSGCIRSQRWNSLFGKDLNEVCPDLCQNRTLSWAGKNLAKSTWWFYTSKTLFLALFTQSLIPPYKETISDGKIKQIWPVNAAIVTARAQDSQFYAFKLWFGVDISAWVVRNTVKTPFLRRHRTTLSFAVMVGILGAGCTAFLLTCSFCSRPLQAPP